MVVEQIESGRSKKGPGYILRSAREEANLSIEDVGAHLRLSPSILGELEDDNYANIMFTFVRGYLRSYAKLLGLSADEIVANFNSLDIAEAKPQAVAIPSAQKGAKIRTRDRRISPEKIARWVGLLVVATLIVLVGFWWHNQTASQPLPASPMTTANADTSGVPPIQTNVLPSNAPPSDDTTTIHSIMLPSQPDSATTVGGSDATAPAAPTPSPAAAAALSSGPANIAGSNPNGGMGSSSQVTMVPSPSSLVDGDDDDIQPAAPPSNIVPLNLGNSSTQSGSGTSSKSKSKSSSKSGTTLTPPFTAN